MRRLLLPFLLLCSIAHAQLVLTTGPGIVVTLSAGCTSVPAPTFSPVAGTYGSTQSVTISDSQSPVTIYYTIDGSQPTAGSTPYTGPVSVASSLTINAIAVSSGCSSSLIGTAQYIINQPPTGTPTFSPSPGTSANTFSITVSDLTAGAVMYCTTDGSTPVVAVSPVCSTPTIINTVGSTTLKAIAKSAGFTQSAVQSGVFTYQPLAASPVISPSTGTYVSSVSVTVTDSCAGATIYYTTNGITPTNTSTVYSGAVTLNVSANFQAMATCPLYAQSNVVGNQYTIIPPAQAPTPTFTPNGGTSSSAIPFVISDGAAGATVYYTLDGSTPTTASTSCAAPCSLTANSTETVRAIATATGFSTSAIGQATYTITGGAIQDCPQTSGTLQVNVTTNRSNGISPLMIWNDATGTTDSGIAANTTTFQDVTYTWDFGDTGTSGNGVWLYGSNPNKNSKNSATGGIASHLYIVPPGGGDQPFSAKVTATDRTNTVTCKGPVITVKDASGVNGFGGAATTCVAQATIPVQGVGGCPAGATVLQSSTYTGALTATFIGSNKRVLFRCGDTFTGNNATITGTKWSVGAYGGCEGTQASRPIFSLGTGSGVNWAATATDGRFSDIDFEGTGVAGGGLAMNSLGSGLTYPSQITVNNVNVNGVNRTYWGFGGHENAIVGLTATGMGNTDGTFLMQSENQCSNGSVAYNCGGTPAYANVNYQAILGSSFDGTGATSGGPWEVVRLSAGRMWVIENSVFKNGFNGGAVLKFHSGNANSQNNWTGQYGELDELSDNLFTGTSGSQLVEIAPQNGQVDERLRNIVFERNLVLAVNDATNGHCKVIASAMNFTARDNVLNSVVGAADTFCLQLTQRGAAYGTGGGAPGNASFPQYNEAYNNTFYGTSALGISGQNYGGPANNSWGMNNLFYRTSGAASAVANTGSGNTVSNNTSVVTNNPAFNNSSTSFSLITDFIPSANYSGGTSVPVVYDGFLSTSNPYGVAWSPTWDLGAISHTNTSPSTVFFAQPSLSGGASGNTKVGGHNYTPGTGSWALYSVEPTLCAGGSDASGLFPTSYNPSANTGLSTTVGNLSWQSGSAPCVTQTGATTAQINGTSMGAFVNSADFCPSYPCSNFQADGLGKFGIFPNIWFAAPRTNPFVNYNGVETGFYLQVPVATYTGGNPAPTGATSNVYASIDVSFVDLAGNEVVISASAFYKNQAAQTKCEKPVKDPAGTGAYELKCQMNVSRIVNPYLSTNPAYFSLASDSDGYPTSFQTAPWTGDKYFHITISQAQFQQGLLDIKNNVTPPASFSTDPNVWMLQHYHLNAEMHYKTGAATLGWSAHGFFINFF